MKFVFAAIVGMAMAFVGMATYKGDVHQAESVVMLQGCNQQQAKTVENGVFTVEQMACIFLNSGLITTSPNASKDIQAACAFAPDLKPYVDQFIANLTGDPAKLAKFKEQAAKMGACKSGG